MKVGCCSIKFFLHGNRSLKEKRRIAKSIKDRLKNTFNVSVAEIGDLDAWQSLHLGIVAVGSDGPYLEGLMNQVVDFIDNMNLAEMTDCQVKTIQVGPDRF
ncbi:MAG: DUF503 domain-containing protein [Nitrospinae bacterium]|nr:DUF503 domain-containing protein [Nitrospinota bacterium]